MKRLTKPSRLLRRRMTKPERILWFHLRNRKLNGYKFRRQHPINEKFILDFYCDKLKLAIELDGIQHDWPEIIKQDKLRTEYLNKQGIRVLRFWNSEILRDIDDVLIRIRNNIYQK